MHTSLQADLQSFEDILRQTQAYASSFLHEINGTAPGLTVPALPLDDLPTDGGGFAEALRLFQEKYRSWITAAAGPRYFGFVTGGVTPASLAGDWLTSTFDQNATNSGASAATLVEQETIHMLRQLLGLPDSFFGAFVTGATMSNFVGLALGRQWVGRQAGIDVAAEGLCRLTDIAVLSGTIHASAVKSLSMLGLGRNSWAPVSTLPGREAIDVTELDNAGTVNTVDFDDIAAIIRLRNKYPFWLHVDAAFGGFAACSDAYRHLLTGWQQADSITIDAHKWLNVPYDSAMIFTRHPALQLAAFQNTNARYLTDPLGDFNYLNYTPENSRRLRALPAWFSLKAYGQAGYQSIIETNVALARQLGKFVENTEAFRLLAPVRLCVVCFTLTVPEPDSLATLVDQLLKRLNENGKVVLTATVYQGIPAIRAALVNWRTTAKDIEITIEELLYALAQINQEIVPNQTAMNQPKK